MYSDILTLLGISYEYCACVVPTKINVSDTQLISAVKASVDYIDTFVSPQQAFLPLGLSHVLIKIK